MIRKWYVWIWWTIKYTILASKFIVLFYCDSCHTLKSLGAVWVQQKGACRTRDWFFQAESATIFKGFSWKINSIFPGENHLILAVIHAQELLELPGCYQALLLKSRPSISLTPWTVRSWKNQPLQAWKIFHLKFLQTRISSLVSEPRQLTEFIIVTNHPVSLQIKVALKHYLVEDGILYNNEWIEVPAKSPIE